VCLDPSCSSVLASGTSSVVANGATADWTVPAALAEGTYFWQARAEDAAGNVSTWTPTRALTVDTVAPDAPEGFVGVVAKGQVKLYWSPPAGGPVRNYVLYIDGVRARVLGGSVGEVKLGKFNLDDARSFDVTAVDYAGNEGPPTKTLVAVPNVIGLKVVEATAALTARGLEVGDQSKAVASAGRVIVVAQIPAAPTLAFTGSPVALVVADQSAQTAGAPLRITATQIGLTKVGKRSCAPTRRLTMKVKLSAAASLTVRFLTARGEPVASRLVGSTKAGVTTLVLTLPPSMSASKVYRLVVTATTKTQVASAEASLAALCSRR
jgi:hypothetical protein